MATKATYHQIYICPSTADADNSVVIPHVESGWCQVVSAEFVGGGGEKRFLLNVISFEPVVEPAESETG